MENIETQKENQISYEEKQTPLQKVGAFLREGRLARSISIEELSSSLRIGKEQVEALENGQEDCLPEMVFIKAMVRRISDKLSLDTNFIIEELKGRDISIKNLYKKPYTKKTKQDYQKLAPLMIITSGLLGLLASIPVINLLNNSTPDPLPEVSISLDSTSQKVT